MMALSDVFRVEAAIDARDYLEWKPDCDGRYRMDGPLRPVMLLCKAERCNVGAGGSLDYTHIPGTWSATCNRCGRGLHLPRGSRQWEQDE